METSSNFVTEPTPSSLYSPPFAYNDDGTSTPGEEIHVPRAMPMPFTFVYPPDGPSENNDFSFIPQPPTLSPQYSASYSNLSDGEGIEYTAHAYAGHSRTQTTSHTSPSGTRGFSYLPYNRIPGKSQRRAKPCVQHGVREETEEDVGGPIPDAQRRRNESERRQRDNLRAGFAELQRALPPFCQKPSHVLLLDRAVTHIQQLETGEMDLKTKLGHAESELMNLRDVNEQLMRSLAAQHQTVMTAAATSPRVISPTRSQPPSPGW